MTRTIQQDGCDRCSQGVMHAERYDKHGRLVASGNDHRYRRCACRCHWIDEDRCATWGATPDEHTPDEAARCARLWWGPEA